MKRIKADHKVHLDHVIGERKSWHHRMLECKNSLDEETMAIYIDGMDQEKTWIPRLAYKSIDAQKEKVMPTR